MLKDLAEKNTTNSLIIHLVHKEHSCPKPKYKIKLHNELYKING